jgi:mRNA interferase MazF
VLVALQGEHGKPRPALIVQADLFNDVEPGTFLVVPFSTTITGSSVRILVEPDQANGLRQRSELMMERLAMAPRSRLRGGIGRLGRETMGKVDAMLAVLLGLVPS